MRHVCLSHDTCFANTWMKGVLTKLLPALYSRQKQKAGEEEEGRKHVAWGSWALHLDNCMGLRVCMPINLPEAQARAKSSSQPSPNSLQGWESPSHRSLGSPRSPWSYLCLPPKLFPPQLPSALDHPFLLTFLTNPRPQQALPRQTPASAVPWLPAVRC